MQAFRGGTDLPNGFTGVKRLILKFQFENMQTNSLWVQSECGGRRGGSNLINVLE